MKINKKDNNEVPIGIALVNNAMDFSFEKMRYELNGVLVDESKNVEITKTMRIYLSINWRVNNENSGWSNGINVVN